MGILDEIISQDSYYHYIIYKQVSFQIEMTQFVFGVTTKV